ncbi:Pkinase-domain-containing protein [Obba rivulosa]|uniref:Serine/threonine-protein kinase n=1 Tax=Obba rivulosa TaxID=1052685 RepID=A0A8E2DFT8_9APHY|nr:Pkinase-domain-containing protein [Obba rivulosa]
MPPPPRRHPLTVPHNHHAVNKRAPAPPGTPPKPHEKAKHPSSPPLPRQNAKVTPPSPPKVIADAGGNFEFTRGVKLGEGGFARVYEIRDAYGARLACKVVTKSSLKTKKAKTKLYAEIKIHKALNHPNIVQFQDCFDDDEHVYMTLELCPNGSLMDMLRARKRFTEPEARFFMVQLIGACHYMHTHQVIHRDLKLGNIFLDKTMNVKVGDFGLAALIESPGERKKTICGTPNYIAPEVLFDTANGHSFEVDTWSIGVILYTLVVGRPPFQTKNVKEIYDRIQKNEYEFPPDRVVSLEVQHLVSQILTLDPSQRPSLHEILSHAWFTRGAIPSYIPHSAHKHMPDFSRLTPIESQRNLARLRRYALLDEDQATSIAIPHPPTAADYPQPHHEKGVTSRLQQQEKEFQRAVQPGSPISALLSSARQPLIVAPASARGEQPLIRKLQAAREAKSPARPRVASGLHNIEEEREDVLDAKRQEQRRKELESQKARIVAQMVPDRIPAPVEEEEEEEENVPPRAPVLTRIEQRMKERVKEKEHARIPERERAGAKPELMPEGIPTMTSRPTFSDVPRGKERERMIPKNEPIPPPIPTVPSHSNIPSMPSSSNMPLKPNSFDMAAQTLTAAFDAKAQGKLFRNPREDADLPVPKVFIVSWVDYCNKYGMGYALTDGSVGVHFNDSTSIVLSPDKVHFDFVSSRRQGSVYVRKNYTISEFPDDLKHKIYLLKHFEGYIMNRLYGEYDYTFEDLGRMKGMDFVQKYLRMKHVIVFKMSHDVLQFNFYDHSKLVLSSHGLHITHIDKNYNLTRWTLAGVMAQALRPPVSDPEQAKFHQRLVDKLKYCKEVLISIQNVSAQTIQGGGVGPEADGHLMTGPLPTMSTRSSKASLRQ